MDQKNKSHRNPRPTEEAIKQNAAERAQLGCGHLLIQDWYTKIPTSTQHAIIYDFLKTEISNPQSTDTGRILLMNLQLFNTKGEPTKHLRKYYLPPLDESTTPKDRVNLLNTVTYTLCENFLPKEMTKEKFDQISDAGKLNMLLKLFAQNHLDVVTRSKNKQKHLMSIYTILAILSNLWSGEYKNFVVFAVGHEDTPEAIEEQRVLVTNIPKEEIENYQVIN